MKLRRLAEISALLARHGESVIESGQPVPDQVLQPYLLHSRELLCRWREASRQPLAPTDASITDVTERETLLSEVLVSELFTRIWVAVLAASDTACGIIHAEPIGRHVLVGVLDVRAHILRELLDEAAPPLGTLMRVNRLRRRIDGWSNLLIGSLAVRYDVLEFAVEPERALEFRDQHLDDPHNQESATWALVSAGIQKSLPNLQVPPERQPQQQSITNTILDLLPTDASLTGPAPRRWPSPPTTARIELPEPLRNRLRSEASEITPPASLQNLFRRWSRRQGPGDALPPRG